MNASRGDNNTNSSNHPPLSVHMNNCNNVSVTSNCVNNESVSQTMNSNAAQPIAGASDGDGKDTGEEAAVGAILLSMSGEEGSKPKGV